MLLYFSLSIIFTSVLFFLYSYSKNKHAAFLSAYFIIIASYGLAHYFTISTQSDFWLAIFYNHFSPLWVLLGPCLYLYVRGTLEDRTGLQKIDWLHGIPFLLYLITTAPYYFKPFAQKLDIANLIHQDLDNLKTVHSNLIFTPTINFIVRPTLLFIYIIACFWLLYKNYLHKKRSANIPTQQKKVTYRWLLLLCITSLTLVGSFLYLTYTFTRTQVSYNGLHQQPVHHFSGVAFLILTISMFFFPEILYGLPEYARLRLNPLKTNSTDPITEPPIDTILIEEELEEGKEDPFSQLAQKILDYLHNEKPYLRQDFAVHDLAIAMDAPNHHISYCLNRILKTNFANLKNKLRVDHAKEMLNSDQAFKMSIEGIGHLSGFATRSNFYSAFKKETGFTPTEYIQDLQTQAN